jgi:GTP-binding protein
MSLKIAIIGKPNVGKSTLFNKLCKRRLAITNDLPGVTRDRKEFKATLGKQEFTLIDTAGLEKPKDNLSQSMITQTLKAAEEAQIILFMIDARHGIDSDDKDFANQIRKLDKKIILIANKCEGNLSYDEKDLYRLGFGTPIFIAAEHNIGFSELEAAITETSKNLDVTTNIKSEDEDQALKISIIGRPNVGKSTIFNKILGFERVITSEVSGTTRDAISYTIQFEGREIELIDTAGLRKKRKIYETIENLSTVETINALRRSHITMMVIDASQPLERQDLTIANVAIKEGRAVLLVINKSDLIEDRKAFLEELEYLLSKNLTEVLGVEFVFISELKNKNLDKLFKAAFKVEKIWKSKISTNNLNKWLKYTTEIHAPPLSKKGRRIKMKYITQTGEKPPTFTIFCNIPSEIPEAYMKYLRNSLRESFGIFGSPLRLKFRAGENPYNK